MSSTLLDRIEGALRQDRKAEALAHAWGARGQLEGLIVQAARARHPQRAALPAELAFAALTEPGEHADDVFEAIVQAGLFDAPGRDASLPDAAGNPIACCLVYWALRRMSSAHDPGRNPHGGRPLSRALGRLRAAGAALDAANAAAVPGSACSALHTLARTAAGVARFGRAYASVDDLIESMRVLLEAGASPWVGARRASIALEVVCRDAAVDPVRPRLAVQEPGWGQVAARVAHVLLARHGPEDQACLSQEMVRRSTQPSGQLALQRCALGWLLGWQLENGHAHVAIALLPRLRDLGLESLAGKVRAHQAAHALRAAARTPAAPGRLGAAAAGVV